jgi:hypothetical protein
VEVRSKRFRVGQPAARAKGKRWGGSKPGRYVKVRPDQVQAITELLARGEKITRVARITGLSRPTIYTGFCETRGSGHGKPSPPAARNGLADRPVRHDLSIAESGGRAGEHLVVFEVSTGALSASVKFKHRCTNWSRAGHIGRRSRPTLRGRRAQSWLPVGWGNGPPPGEGPAGEHDDEAGERRGGRHERNLLHQFHERRCKFHQGPPCSTGSSLNTPMVLETRSALQRVT